MIVCGRKESVLDDTPCISEFVMITESPHSGKIPQCLNGTQPPR